MASAKERKQAERARKRKAGLVYRGFWVKPAWVARISAFIKALG